MATAEVGLAARPAAAQTTVTIGDATEATPASQGLCPRANGSPAVPVAVDAFTLQATSPVQITRLEVRLEPADAYLNVARLEIRGGSGDLDSAPLYGSLVPGPSNTSLHYVNLTTPVSVTPSAVTYRIAIVPKEHGAMQPPRSGKSIAVRALLNRAMGQNIALQGSDPTTATITIRNAPPPNVAWEGISTDATSITLDWMGTPDVLVARRALGPVVDVPADGATYGPGAFPGGTSQIVYASATLGAFADGGLTPGTPYYYRLFVRDALCNDYSTGTALGPVYAGGASEGDDTPGSTKPVVGIANPISGPVTSPFRVQVRVVSPGQRPITAVKLYGHGGSGEVELGTLTRNANFGPPAPDSAWSGVYELTSGTYYRATASGAGGLDLPPGPWTLRAWASNATGGVHSGGVGVVVSAASRGDGSLLVRDNSDQLCADCHEAKGHSAESLGMGSGSWYVGCRGCHQPHGTTNAKLVATSITPPSVNGVVAPTKVFYAGKSGVQPGARVNAEGTGLCQVCHTRTARWRGASAPDASHRGDCGFCHRHAKGFGARCEDCHGVPPATGAHRAHQGASAPAPPFPSDPRPLGCGNCHSTDPARHGDGVRQVTLDPALVLPGGTRTTGARLDRSSSGTTCLVACHSPLGAAAPAQPVAWSAVGPLPCTSCHSKIDPAGRAPTPRAGPSLHEPLFSESRPASGGATHCFSCHASASHDATHLTGNPGLAANVNAVCVACHTPPSGPPAAPGEVLQRGGDAATSRTPPILPGWSEATLDASSGDFHGGRRGTCFGPSGPQPCAPGVTPTGYGGTLRAPYYRGYPAMPCATCHAGHASENSFLFAGVVNGTPIPPGSIDRTGVGAERLCDACHAGGRHDRCKECHTSAIICPDGQCYMDPNAPHVDPAPAGSGCFWCHGHEGILRWTEPYSGGNMDGAWDASCDHCHGFQMPAVRFAPPAIASGAAPSVTRVTATSAVVTWGTDVPASSRVEYGIGLPGYVAGSGAEVASHSVTLSALTPGTTYVWRVRSVDAFRNVLRTPISTFTTSAPDAVPVPDILPVGSAGAPSPQTTATVDLRWYPVSTSTGNAVEYRVQLASDPTFTTLVNGSPPDSGWIPGTPGTAGGTAIRSFRATLTNLPMDDCGAEPPFVYYRWRVKARDALTGRESEWSIVDTFSALSWDPYGC